MTPYIILLAACVTIYAAASIAGLLAWAAGMRWQENHNEKGIQC